GGCRSERAVPVTQEDRDTPEIRDGEIRLPISIKVSDRHRSWLCARGKRGGGCESPIAHSEENRNIVRIDVGDCEIEFPVAIEIAGREACRIRPDRGRTRVC